ncbi:DUF2341 domain-containing protein [Nanohaloarchaea archaeon]|nr:DUF2341 domain-containing protein [Candidatus Nanohaloarchaea archaeon]
MQCRFKEMKIGKFLVLAIFSLIFISGAAAEWYNSDWDYRKEITFNQSQISGSNEDFPTLINISDSDLKEKAQNNGDDVLFTSSNGSYQLDHEIELYNNSSGRLTAHVKVLNMTNQSQTSIYMYYGNPEASGQENASRVWSGYEAVYHLNETASSTSEVGVYEDATNNDYDGEDQVSDQGKTGYIDRGQEFDGSDDYIYNSSVNNSQDPVFSMSMWVKRTGKISQDGFWGLGGGSSGTGINNYIRDSTDCQENTIGWDLWASQRFYTDAQYPLDEWIHVGWVKNDTGMVKSSLNSYVDGNRKSLEKVCGSGDDTPNVEDGLTMGTIGNNYGGSPVILDEVRYYKGVRTQGWISTQFNNQNSASSFHTVQEEEKVKSSEYVRTFSQDKPRSFFANNTTVNIRTDGEFSSSPDITIVDSQGTRSVEEGSMTNVSGVFEYNFTANQSVGWYRVEINGQAREKVFYQSEEWQNNFTDAEGNKYTFRRELNLSEPSLSDRFFTPINVNLDFGFSPDNDSIRVVSWNGSRILEIPSQIFNVSKSEEAVSNANIVFLSSMNQSENRTYYVVSSKSEYSKNYTGLNNTDNSLDEKVENSYFKAFFNQSMGYLMRDLKNKFGTSSSLSGAEPMDRYPQVDISPALETITKKARADLGAEIDVTQGPLFTEVKVEGDLNKDTNFPYSVDCKIYAANPYMICEKNLTTLESQNWQKFYFNGLVFEDGKFSYSAYRSSTGDLSTRALSSGDNSDYTGLDSNMRWIAFFNNKSADGVAEIFLEKDFTETDQPEIRLNDDSGNDFYQHLVIEDREVKSGDYWSTKTARLVYNGLREAEYVNKTYNRLDNPVSVSKGNEVTDDKSVVNYSRKGNISSNDSSPVKVFSRWKDDTFLDRARINITGNGVNGSNTELYFNNSYGIRDSGEFTNESWVNVTLESPRINAGRISANITVFDVANKSNSTQIEFNVSDTTAPKFRSVINNPNKSSNLDPKNQVNITANITEYSNVSTAFLYYKNETAPNYRKVKMDRQGETDFVHTYEANFTPRFEQNYTYYVSANDTLDQKGNNSRNNISIAYELTWNFNSNFREAADTFKENISIGNFTINNTGDFNQTFRLSTGVFNSRTWVNGTRLPTEFEIGNDTTKFFAVNATTRDSTNTEGLDTFNLTVENTSASPEVYFSSFDVITSTGGPFLSTKITDFNSTAIQGDSGLSLTARTTNKGNESASRVNITFELPNSWTVSAGEGLRSENTPTLFIGTSKTFETKFNIPTGASTGTKTVKAVARSQETNRSTSVQVTVEKKDSDNNQQGSSSSGGGAGGSGSSGAGDSSLSSSQQEKLFQTEETYEIVRGQDQNFSLTVENPFQEGELEDVRVNVSGFLSQYLSVEPKEIDKIGVNESKNFSINVEAPRYFSRGEYSLNFNITGINNRSQTYTTGNQTYLARDTQEFKENRKVELIVHEISKEKASEALNQSREAAKELEKQGVMNTETKELISEARDALSSGNYQKTRSLSQQIQNKRQKAETSKETIQEVESLIDKAEYRDLEAPKTERMVSMASAALERGDYSMAANRAEEAKNLYALETKGEINYVNFAKRNWQKLGLAVILLIGFSTGVFLRFRLFRIKRKLSKLEEEEETLLGLMKQVQRESFEEGKMSMEEYEEAMMQYEKQLSQNVKDTVRLESRKAHWKNIRKGRERYEHERDRIQDLMQETQKKYLEEGEIETRVYKQKMQSFRERLTELEGKLAEMEAQKQINKETGLRSYLPGLPNFLRS